MMKAAKRVWMAFWMACLSYLPVRMHDRLLHALFVTGGLNPSAMSCVTLAVIGTQLCARE
jgi:hypothetical protein